MSDTQNPKPTATVARSNAGLSADVDALFETQKL